MREAAFLVAAYLTLAVGLTLIARQLDHKSCAIVVVQQRTNNI